MSLATDLRPTSLDQVIGQEMVVRALKRMFAGQIKEVPKAILFSGPPGCGKTTLARIIANMLEAEVEEINASDKSGVDDARQLAERAGYRPLNGHFRVVILDEFHRATADAQNVLLKPTEADNTATLWLFCTTAPQKLIKPLRDRCIEFQLKPLAEADAAELVERAIKNLDANLDPNKSIIKARTKMIGVDLIGEIYHTRDFESPRVILNALEKVLAGVSLEEAVSANNEDPEFIEIARAVSKGDWATTAELLKKFKGTDVQGISRVVKGYLKTTLLNSFATVKAENISEAILGISTYVKLDSDLSDLTAALYKACKKMRSFV